MTINAMVDDTLSTLEAAEILGVTRRTVQLWVESGVLIAWKTPGGHRKVTSASVHQIIAKRSQTIADQISHLHQEFTVLYVEDDEAQRKLFQKYFSKSKKFKLLLANNGFEGLVSLGKEKPNLLIADLKMPGMDGFQMIQVLKKNKAFSDLNIVVLTSMSADEIDEHGGLATNIKLFTKPGPLKKLDVFIDQLILANNKSQIHAN